MNIYYRVTQVGRGTTYYELEIPFQSYYITIYFATTHLPHKRLTKYRPLSYFMIFPRDVLAIAICPKGGEIMKPDHEIKIEKSNMGILKLLIKKVGEGISGIGLIKDVKPGDIINEFLKTLY